MTVWVARVVLFIATDFNLFEPPRWQDRVWCDKIASREHVSEPEFCRQTPYTVNLFFSPQHQVVDDLNLPMVTFVTSSSIPIA